MSASSHMSYAAWTVWVAPMQRMQCLALKWPRRKGTCLRQRNQRKPQGQKDVVCIRLFVCPPISSHCITGAWDGHRWITSETSDASGVAGSQQGCSDPRPPGRDMWVRSSPEGNVLHNRNAGEPVYVPISSHRKVRTVKCHVPTVWTPRPFCPLVSNNWRPEYAWGVNLLSYQPVGASLQSVNVILTPGNATAGPSKVLNPRTKQGCYGMVPGFIESLIVATS